MVYTYSKLVLFFNVESIIIFFDLPFFGGLNIFLLLIKIFIPLFLALLLYLQGVPFAS